jgi:hypothetical protein
MDTIPKPNSISNPNQTLVQGQTITPKPELKQTLTTPPGNTCRQCQNPITENVYFCPNCGKKIKEPPFKLKWGNVFGILFASILLPPLGIFPGLRYLRYKELSAKILGLSAIILTLLFTFIMFYVFIGFFNNMNKTYNTIYNMGGNSSSNSPGLQENIDILKQLF